MKPARLLNSDKGKVRLASRSAVQDYFNHLVVKGVSTHWLDAGNRYRETATQTYADDLSATPKSVDEKALIAYIAASAPTHLIDGWSYVARATEAVLRGDLNVALHLGYYAELRAAMSLLACEGIGVFNTRHPVISPAGTQTTEICRALQWDRAQSKYLKRGAGTHMVVWPLLSHWGSLKRAADLVNKLVAPEGYGLDQWIDVLAIPRPVRAISKGWFSTWGIDLGMLSEDHESRNMVSYRPSEFRLPPAPSAQKAIEFVSALWALFEPSTGGRFPQVERELLRKVVRESGKPVDPAAIQSKLGMDIATANNWAKFLVGTDDSLLLTLAEQSSNIEDTDCSLQVISRAALLLFLATGSTRKHLIDAGYSQGMLDFFWKRLCEARFDGAAASLPADPMDLWRDIEDHISDAENWRATATPNTPLGEWRKDQPSVASQIASLELAGVWGLVS